MTNINEVVNTKTITGKVYQMLETALIVSEVFTNLLVQSELDENYVYGESESDTYATLTGYVLDIEKENTEETPLYIEDIREIAEDRILKDYGKKKKYQVSRSYYKTVTVEAENEEEALKIASEKDLFASVSLDVGDDVIIS